MEYEKAIDWELAVKITNNKPEIAEELLSLFITDLPQTQQEINLAYKNSDYELLAQLIHKLHGATCYCGVPKLREISSHLETKLKIENDTNIKSLIDQLNDEILRVIKTFKEHDY